jgi:hypothetical protein
MMLPAPGVTEPLPARRPLSASSERPEAPPERLEALFEREVELPSTRPGAQEKAAERPVLPRAELRPAPIPAPAARHVPERIEAASPARRERGERGPSGIEERRSEPLPPVINVTIGRIEVRAPAAPSAPSAPRPEAPRPAVSLEEYLQRRAEGRF